MEQLVLLLEDIILIVIHDCFTFSLHNILHSDRECDCNRDDCQLRLDLVLLIVIYDFVIYIYF